MKQIIEKMNSKKEYAAPQMEIIDHVVQGFLCGSDEHDDPSGGVVECDDCP